MIWIALLVGVFFFKLDSKLDVIQSDIRRIRTLSERQYLTNGVNDLELIERAGLKGRY